MVSPGSGEARAGGVRGRRREGAHRSLPTAADFYVDALPGLSPSSSLSLHSGLLPATLASSGLSPLAANNDASASDPMLYFLLASARHIARAPKLLIWLNGGPGCSSLNGGFLEVGPFSLNEAGDLVERDNAWNEYANVLFLDQPAGTGYSYITKNDNARELVEIADQVVAFLSNFYQVFPEYATMDLFLAGESYSGQYIPYIANALLSTTVLSPAPRLSGLIIGNGWFSARQQYPAYLDFLVEEKHIRSGSKGFKSIDQSLKKCIKEMDSMEAKNGGELGFIVIPICEEVLTAITDATKNEDGLCLNQYDTRLYQTCGAEWPEGLRQLTPYLRRPDVIKALHVESSPTPWSHCSDAVSAHFWTRKSLPSVALLPSLLAKVPILLYAGDKDMMCSHTGIEAVINSMEFNGETGFNGTKGVDWSVDSRVVGEWTTARNLTYVRFSNSSHMVPIDEPLASHDMLLRFLAVDTLFAAGTAAVTPSTIGSETSSILAPTHPNGTTLLSSTLPANGSLPGTPSSSTASIQQGFAAGLDPLHEAYYGPRRSAGLAALLILGAAAIYGFFKWRSARRLARKAEGRYGRVRSGNNSRRSSKRMVQGAVKLSQMSAIHDKRSLSAVREVEEADEKERAGARSNSRRDEEYDGHGKDTFSKGSINDEYEDYDDEVGDDDDGDEDEVEEDGDIGSSSNPWKSPSV